MVLESIKFMQISKFFVVAVFLCCFCGLNVSAASLTTLDGTYHFFSQGSSYWKSYHRIANEIGEIKFNNDFTCSATWAESVSAAGLVYTGSFFSYPPLDYVKSCTYSLSSGNQVNVDFADGASEKLWVTTDANIIIGGGGGKESLSNGTEYKTDLLVGLKQGDIISKSSLIGPYQFSKQGLGFKQFNGYDYIYDKVFSETGVVTFDGNGGCTATWTETNYDVPIGFPQLDDNESTEGPLSCTYTVAANGEGELVFPGRVESMWVSEDAGSLLIGGGGEQSDAFGNEFNTDLLLGVKQGSTLNAASLNGNYHFVSQESGFWKNNSGAINDRISGGTGTIGFDGKGTCAVTWNETAFETGLTWNDGKTVVETPSSGGPKACTYKVSSTGKGQLTFADGMDVFWVSADGNTLLNGGGWKATFSEGTEYRTSLLVGVKENQPCSQPASITVPAADPDGNYIVKWGASATSGVTYIVEEAGDSAFSNPQTVYSGPALYTNLYNRLRRTNYYRVKATHPEYADSAWREAAVGCSVPGTTLKPPVSLGFPVSESDSTYRLAPAVDADGDYKISWVASATTPADVTYVVQEATNSTFTSGLREIYSATTSATVEDRSPNVTYYYRVKARKAGYKDSSWKAGAMLKVHGLGIPAATPPSITVPAADVDGAYVVKWKASATKGASYVLEEAKNAEFTDAVVVYEGKSLNIPLTAREKDKTYFYRVKATHPEYADSTWREKTIGCAVPGTLLATPASITVPASDADGTYDLKWGTSASVGVTYVVEEATNGTFTLNRKEVFRGDGMTTSIVGRSGGVYYYRVKAVKPGYKDSAWKKAAFGCRVVPGSP